VPKLLAAYCYILSHPGMPCVFWQHVYGKKNGAGLTNGKEPDVTLSEEDGRIDGRGVWVPPNNPGFTWDERWPGQEPWSVGSQVRLRPRLDYITLIRVLRNCDFPSNIFPIYLICRT
jgi:hypothetical protein